MPACEPCCPLVKAQLKKIAAENPWLLKKDLSLDGKSEIKHHVDTATYTKVSSRSQTTMVSKIKGEGHDKLLGTDAIEHTSRFAGDSTSRIVKKVDRDQETAKEGSLDDTDDTAIFPDQCEPSCPRQISRRTRKRKLEERQRIVDAYLLSKGAGYFEDICTCSLSCVVHALRDDTFVRSILMSAAFFTLGLKLCSELDAWHLPIRLS